MSKFIFLLLTVFISVNSMSQDKDLPELSFDTYDFPKSIVVDVQGKSLPQLKAKIQNWLDDYYTESTLLNCKFSDQTFTITGLENRLLEVKNLTSDLQYQLKISLRDNKYRFKVLSISYSYYTEFRPIANVNLINDEIIKRDLLDSRSTLSSFFKDLNLALYNFIKNDQEEW
ncbi:hypothetical protein LB450_10235 [Psychroflexus sp. CAK1W]|uniref:hypothetical protein n=1 Tax=Psychroflexus curvus TaxID=2873595 RepID=UPI001CCC5F35|nr:hypothetical protein [Psychroflexus curvus]MBZ9628477.1 hypothetical protein [Psychroflexus curvus]